MVKDCKVVMLPIDKKAKFNDLVINPFFDWLFQFKHQNCTEYAQHLYILSDEEIKQGDWILDIKNPIKPRQVKTKHLLEDLFDTEKKIIATTDSSLTREIFGLGETAMCPLPKPPQSFIDKFVEQYNKENVIENVMVEYVINNKGYDKKEDFPYQECEILKVNQSNEITTI